MIKTATDYYGEKLNIGDIVEGRDIYSKELKWMGNKVVILEIKRQGYDGTILICDSNPSPEYQYSKTITARDVRKII